MVLTSETKTNNCNSRKWFDYYMSHKNKNMAIKDMGGKYVNKYDDFNTRKSI